MKPKAVTPKTTIELPKPVLLGLKRLAARRKTTMKAIIVESVQRTLREADVPAKPFKLRDGSFKGNGLQPGVDLSNWDQIRDMIYEGRGA